MQYLRTRKRGNSVSRFVRVPVPVDLQAAYPGQPCIERYLKPNLSTEDVPSAVAMEVAIIRDEFDVKRGRGKSLSIAEGKAKHEATRQMFQWLMDNASAGPGRLSDVLPSSPDEAGQPVTRIKAVLGKVGETVPEGELERIGDAITEGELDALALFHKGLKPSIAAPKHSRTFDEVSKSYFEFVAHDKDAAWTAQTTAQYESTVRLFSNHIGGNKPIATIDTDAATGFLDKVAKLHPDWGRHGDAKKLSLDQLLAKYPGKLSNKTINRHHIALRGIFEWAMGRKWYPKEEGNPFAFKLRKKGDREKLPFTLPMLNALLETPNPKPAKHNWDSSRPWFSIIALYSGLRQDEIGALTVDAIIEADGVTFFNITDAKSPAGVRRLPIHSVILEYGFLAYVKHIGSGTLWPGLKPGGKDLSRGYAVAKKFPAFRRRVGAKAADGDDSYSFHSFRKNAVSEFVRQRVHLSEYAELIGHERSFTNKHYAPQGLTPEIAKMLIEKLTYPGIILPPKAAAPAK